MLKMRKMKEGTDVDRTVIVWLGSATLHRAETKFPVSPHTLQPVYHSHSRSSPLRSFSLHKENNLDLYQSLPKKSQKITLSSTKVTHTVSLLSIPPLSQMASLSISAKLALPNSLLYSQTPKTLLRHNLSIVSRSSRSNFYGLKLLHSPSLTTLSSSSYSTKSSIFAKVHTLLSNFIVFFFFSDFFKHYLEFVACLVGGKRLSASTIHIKRSRWKRCEPLQVQRQARGGLFLSC